MLGTHFSLFNLSAMCRSFEAEVILWNPPSQHCWERISANPVRHTATDEEKKPAQCGKLPGEH